MRFNLQNQMFKEKEKMLARCKIFKRSETTRIGKRLRIAITVQFTLLSNVVKTLRQCKFKRYIKSNQTCKLPVKAIHLGLSGDVAIGLGVKPTRKLSSSMKT